MQVSVKIISDTVNELTITADENDLAVIKRHTVERLAPKVKLAGFRDGKVPAGLAEKQLDPNTLQSEVLNDAINQFYIKALDKNQIRPIAQPKVAVIKYVPYTNLQFSAEVEVIGQIKLPDYKNVNVKKAVVKVTAKDIDEVLKKLQQQAATYSEVKRAAKLGDRMWIDFAGEDTTGQTIDGTKSDNYPLFLGSDTFIPGFETNLIGLKAGDQKSFTVVFPKVYPLKAMQSRPVTFKVKVLKVENVKTDPIDDALAAKVGQFKTLTELKQDIKRELSSERERQAQQDYEDQIVKTIAQSAELMLPQSLLEQQMSIVEQEFRQNLTYRHETFDGYLANNALTEAAFRDQELKPAAEMRLRAGLVLSQIAELEKIVATEAEIDMRLQILKGQYSSNDKIAEDLAKPESRQEVTARIISEKTVAKLIEYADQPKVSTPS